MYASGENTSGNVPAFLMKVWTLVEDPSTDELIYWDPSGTSFHVYDQQRFSREILPMYFKHNNIASFIRQLNMYGFRKVAHIDQGGLKIENDDLHFQHPYFQRGEKELLQHIKRKVSSTSVRADALTAVKNDEVSRVLTDVNQIKSKQQDTDQNLDYIKRENKLLWREIASLRQKHHKQQEIVNKLIQFLVSLVSSNRTGLTIPQLRRAPLAIDSVVSSPPSVASVNNLNVAEESSTPPNYTIESPKAGEVVRITTPGGTTGPIIHELSDASAHFLHSPHTITVESSPINMGEASVVDHGEISSMAQPPIVIMQPTGVGTNVGSAAALLTSPIPSPKIEQVPTLEDALHFEWMTSPDAATPTFVTPTPPQSVPTTLTSPQGKSSNQKRKRTKPAVGLSMSESSPTKKSNTASASSTTTSTTSTDSLMTPDILSTDQAHSTLDQLVMTNNMGKGDATLALSTSNPGDDVSISSNQLDFLSSDLDGLRGLLQEQYKLDPSILYDLFESSNPWPIVADKNPEEELDRREEPGTSDDGADRNIIGTELVTYNPKELFPDLLEDGVIGDIDDID